jgi:hypothetical protein
MSVQPRFKTSIFLSYPKPCMLEQQEFIEGIRERLDSSGFAPRTLGVTDYDMDAPLKAIRRLMLESNGLITVAFRRAYIHEGTGNYSSTIADRLPYSLNGQWLTTPWAHIEPAMAYQIGLPILILRERGVVEDGILERGVVGTYMPVFDTGGPLDAYFSSPEWSDMIRKWEGQVRAVVEQKGNPPQLY